jgi:hypothetical protein
MNMFPPSSGQARNQRETVAEQPQLVLLATLIVWVVEIRRHRFVVHAVYIKEKQVQRSQNLRSGSGHFCVNLTIEAR